MIARNHASTERRFHQLERVLLVAELLAPLRQGAGIPELVQDVSEIMGETCTDRTIRRDLHFLETLGIVERCRDGRQPARWRWVDRSIRSVIYERAAAIRESRRDPCAA